MSDAPFSPLPDNLERCYWCAGLLLNFVAETADTAGRYTLIDSVVRRGTEPPPHLHTYEDEELLLLEGQLHYRLGQSEGLLNPGEYLWMPRRQAHHFECLTPQVRLLVRLSPGGLEEGFKAFGVAVKDSLLPPPREGVPAFESIVQIFAEHGVYFLHNPEQ
ncbi:MAG: cupin domain-containing protein [Thermaceae bacterium]|nr:cupin domain-containing protein [Thermaceae bacterium]